MACQPDGLQVAESSGWLDDNEWNTGKRRGGKRLKDVPRELTVAGPLFDESESSGPAERLPHLDKLPGKNLSINRADADIREIVAAIADGAFPGGVIPLLRIVERTPHEAFERDRPGIRDLRREAFLKAW